MKDKVKNFSTSDELIEHGDMAKWSSITVLDLKSRHLYAHNKDQSRNITSSDNLSILW